MRTSLATLSLACCLVRSLGAQTGPTVQIKTERLSQQPVLRPQTGWSEQGLFNPTAIRFGDKTVLLFRAQDKNGTSRIGYAESTDGLHFQTRPDPVLLPEAPYEKNGGVEDPRVVEINGLFYLTYTGYDTHSAQLCLATSRDLIHWDRKGVILPAYQGTWNTQWTKSGAIVPQQIDGWWWMYYLGTRTDPDGKPRDYMGLAKSKDLLHWTDATAQPVLPRRPGKFDERVMEPGSTPILTRAGILLLYNGATEKLVYGPGWALFDREDPAKLLARSDDSFVAPELAWEKVGTVPNVIFLEGAVADGPATATGVTLTGYYGAADKYIGALRIQISVHAGAPTITQSLNFENIRNPKISPDGKLVVYEVNKPNWQENAFETQLWLASATKAFTPFALTSAKKNSSNAEWSPDSRQLAFTSDRDGKRQLYTIAATGGEARQITKVETAVSTIHWAPDGKSIAYVAAEPETPTLKDRKDRLGDFEIVHNDYVQERLWRQSLDGSPARLLTPNASFSIADFDWAPDSRRLAFTAVANPTPGSSGTAEIYTLALDGSPWHKLDVGGGPNRNPHWSPDGSHIAFQTAAGEKYFFYANDKIALVPAAGGTPRILSQSFDEDKSLLAWRPEGLYFEAAQKTAAYLFLLDPTTDKVSRIGENDGLFSSAFSLAADGRHVALLRSGPASLPEVYAAEMTRYAPVAITNANQQADGFSFAQREVISWKSKDGTTIEGVLLKPANFDPKKKYPLLVVIHGGPTGVDRATLRPDTYYPVEQFVQQGALVLRPNYRGSAGYGAKMRALNVRNLGVGDSWDVLSGVDHLIAQGFVDPDRMGCMGWSQGGYISAFLTTSSKRFKAISVGAGISDWSTYYVNTDITPFTPQYLKATPWDDPEIYRKTSPISYIKTASTPTLIQHGELDKRVPIPNGYELRQALEDRGVPVKMIVYKGFGHGIDKPKQQRAVMEHNWEWFRQYIWGVGQ